MPISITEFCRPICILKVADSFRFSFEFIASLWNGSLFKLNSALSQNCSDMQTNISTKVIEERFVKKLLFENFIKSQRSIIL